MTDTKIETLIAEARQMPRQPAWPFMQRLADALEQVTAERDALHHLRDRWQSVVDAPGFTAAVEAEAQAYHESACSYRAERDAALAGHAKPQITAQMVEAGKRGLAHRLTYTSLHWPNTAALHHADVADAVVRAVLNAALGTDPEDER